MTPDEQDAALLQRQHRKHPWHSPPHRMDTPNTRFIISAACYEHASILGLSIKRLDVFSDTLLEVCTAHAERLHAWCVLPNHYHIVVTTQTITSLLKELGTTHGRTSHTWNGEEARRGRKVWFNAVEREMRSDAHLWASINYVHHNPVKHGYSERWSTWPWSSAREYLTAVGSERAAEIWRAYPVDDYGKGWDW